MTAAPISASVGVATDAGLKRTHNEDSYLAESPLFIVADGMGGHAGGEIASGAVVEEFGRLVGMPSVSAEELRAVFDVAAERVRTLPDGSGAGSGTTISGVAISSDAGVAYWLVVNLGDSRTYRLADGMLEQISVDHSVVQELMDRGELSTAAAAIDPRRNVVTKAIGAGSSSVPDIWLIPARSGDRMLVCSDGLSGELTAQRIARVMLDQPDPQSAATQLVHEALLHGGRDNVTVIIVDALSVEGERDAATVPDLCFDDLDRTIPRDPEGAA